MRLLFATAIALGVAAPTLGQVINEDLKLLPIYGAADAEFGFSIAIDNGADANGTATFITKVPLVACTKVYMQALDIASCEVTNVVLVE